MLRNFFCLSLDIFQRVGTQDLNTLKNFILHEQSSKACKIVNVLENWCKNKFLGGFKNIKGWLGGQGNYIKNATISVSAIYNMCHGVMPALLNES